MKKINTLRFGELEIEEDKIVQFDEGIPAFEDEHEFVLLPYESDSPYTFLQSVKSPELAFMMGVPFVFFPDYEFQLEDEIAQKLGIKTPEDILIYTLITIPGGEIKNMTANLVAPIVISKRTFLAKQVVLEKSKYTTKHRLFKEEKEEK
ncbi:MAG: flagellar assembly protein FliW [Schwartzia succinivorans]|jgi:flagellar assembly factor FliW|nr:flagellar assembly protein FliW [Schwartzia succinivorans]